MAPTPLPLESGGAVSQFMGDGGGMDSQMGTISLGALIQYINQRTYSDLLNLAEILPRKSDLEKKIHIVQFAQKTRQMYVRLLALVKWAASASKVDKCCHITAFLEKQNSLIIDTADKLYQMTKENLVSARLPHFHIPAAVETLTTGSYTRLPLAIRQRILPPEPITTSEKKQTLAKIEQIIQHRLVTCELPKQMRTSNIENGRVKFTVEYEFEVSLTLMSDNPSEPWRLLEVDILVEDKETGEGKELVHPLQISYLYQLVQSRLQDNSSPLIELYTIFHSFCQSLQLEVLYAQTLKLLEDRLDTHIRIEEYLQGKSLTLTYWRELSQKSSTSGGHFGYRFTVQIDPTRASSPLMLMHTPVLATKEAEIAERAIRSDQLSIERLLVHTIYMRTKSRLMELKSEFDDKFGPNAEKCQLSGSPAVLNIPVLQPCFKSEQLLIAVDTHTGVLIPHIPQYDNFPRIKELKTCLNHEKTKLDDVMADLRFFIMVRRAEKTLQHLEAAAHERLPLMYDTSHPLHSLSKNKIYITFHRHPTYILIVEVLFKPDNIFEMETKIFLLSVKEASIEDNPKDDSVQSTIPKSYLRAYKLLSLDSFLSTHGPSTSVDCSLATDGPIGGKRKLLQTTPDTSNKRSKAPAYFLRDVAQIVALCDQIFPLAQISHELEAVGVQTSGVQVEDGGMDVALRLADLPSTNEISSEFLQIMQKHIISITIRTSVMMKFNVPQQCKNNKSLIVEYVFTHCPIRSMTQKEQMGRRLVTFAYEAPTLDTIDHILKAIIDDWVSLCKLYEVVHAFSIFYNSINEPSLNANIAVLNKLHYSSNLKILGEIVKVRSFNYKSITLMYGPSFAAYVNVKYSADKKKFVLHFGLNGNSQNSINVHARMIANFEDLVSRKGEYGLTSLMLHLYNSYQPLLDLMNLRKTHIPNIFEKLQKYSNQWPTALRMFHIIARSASCVHVIYRRVYCLEIEFLNNGLVSIRDGAFSKFQTSRAVEDFTPIKGLKAFLSKYVDENAISRRRSQSEDDNPPTPIPLDDSPWPPPPKPSSPARHGPITPPVSSNPHTPASPHPVAVGGTPLGGFNPSPASGFPLSSPPSMGNMNPSPAGHISHPSPGGLLSHPSPGGLIGSSSPSTQGLGVASPGFPVPSPLAHSLSSHSPAGPYLAAGSVSAQVSRILPNRPYAAAIPTILTLDAFHTICSFSMMENGFNCTALEHFFGSTFLNKHLQQIIRTFDPINVVAPAKDHANYQLKMESFCTSFHLETSPIYSLRVKLQPTPEYGDKWTAEELQSLELLFSKKVSCEPYRVQPLEAFMTMLRFPYLLLRDSARIIHLELFGLGPQSQQQLKWSVNWCMTVPIHSKAIMPPSQAAVYISPRKILCHMCISRIPTGQPSDNDPAIIVMPVVYDDTNKKLSVARKNDAGGQVLDRMDHIYQMIIELMSRVQMPGVEPSMYNCVREVLLNFSLGTESQQPTVSSLSSPHMSPRPATSTMMASTAMTNTTMSSGQQSYQQAPNSHMQATNINLGHQQGMASMQGQMPNMGSITHGNIPGGMMQPTTMGRGAIQNIGSMQPNQTGFGANMMGQFQRQL